MKKRLLMIGLALLICLTLLPTSVLAAPWFITFTGDLETEYEVAEGGMLTLIIDAKIGNSQNPVGWTYSYQWYKKAAMGIWFAEISGATGNSYTIPSASKMYSAGQYYCKVTATHTDSTTVSANSTTATVMVVDAPASPVITSPLSDPPVIYVEKNAGLPESPPSVQAHSTDGGTLSYQWYGMSERYIEYGFNQIVGPGSTTNTLLLQNYANAGAWYYKCEVTNTKGGATATAWSPVFTVIVNPTAGVSYAGGTNMTAAAGDTLTIDVTATAHDSGSVFSYTWFKEVGGVWIPESYTGSSYPVDTSEIGVYRYYCVAAVTAYRAERSYGMAPVTVTVTASDTPGTGTPYIFPFTDVADSAWYRGDVEIAHKNGLINGTSATKYSPDNNMTYAEAIKLAACMHQLYHDDAVTLTNGSPYWYSSYVEYALANGIISGVYPNYNAQITRRDFVHIFYHALPPTEYSDINSVADNAIPDVRLTDTYGGEIYGFYRAGILVGSDSRGTFNPASNIRRSEVAAILTRMFDNTARRSITLP